MRESSNDGKNFLLPRTNDCMIAFPRILYDEEMLIVYNDSTSGFDEEYIGIDSHLNPEDSAFRFRYGDKGKMHVLKNEDGTRHFIKLRLKPGQFVILSNKTSVSADHDKHPVEA